MEKTNSSDGRKGETAGEKGDGQTIFRSTTARLGAMFVMACVVETAAEEGFSRESWTGQAVCAATYFVILLLPDDPGRRRQKGDKGLGPNVDLPLTSPDSAGEERSSVGTCSRTIIRYPKWYVNVVFNSTP